MYIKAFYALCVSLFAVAIQVVMLFTTTRDTSVSIIFAALSCIALIALFIGDRMQRDHMRLNRMHKAHEYRTHRATHGY